MFKSKSTATHVQSSQSFHVSSGPAASGATVSYLYSVVATDDSTADFYDEFKESFTEVRMTSINLIY